MILGRTQLAAALGVNAVTIDAWVREGCPFKTKGSRGVSWEFVLPDVVHWQNDRIKRQAIGDGPTDLETARQRKLAAEAELAELELAKAKADVGLISEFESAMAKRYSVIRVNVMNVPQRAVLQLLGCTDESEFKDKLRKELVLALETAAQESLDGPEEDDE
jgi:phage terminase Nu1 subunit (DNA packaging protein)